MSLFDDLVVYNPDNFPDHWVQCRNRLYNVYSAHMPFATDGSSTPMTPASPFAQHTMHANHPDIFSQADDMIWKFRRGFGLWMQGGPISKQLHALTSYDKPIIEGLSGSESNISALERVRDSLNEFRQDSHAKGPDEPSLDDVVQLASLFLSERISQLEGSCRVMAENHLIETSAPVNVKSSHRTSSASKSRPEWLSRLHFRRRSSKEQPDEKLAKKLGSSAGKSQDLLRIFGCAAEDEIEEEIDPLTEEGALKQKLHQVLQEHTSITSLEDQTYFEYLNFCAEMRRCKAIAEAKRLITRREHS